MKHSSSNPGSQTKPGGTIDLPEEWSWHHQTLLQICMRLTRKRDEREAAIRAALERGGTDSCDVATEEQEKTDMVIKLLYSEAELAEVEAALERIRQGTYGICVATGRRIEPERLRTIPWTRFSYDAASRLKLERGRTKQE